jgi:penicillin-binding protein 1B
MTKSRSRSRKKTPPPRPTRRWWPLFGKLALVALLLLTVALVWLDVLVRQRFDTHQWQLPARVYARPVELYVGRELAREHLLRLLDLMRYRVDPAARTPGAYSVNGSSVLLHTRGFNDSDGGEKPRLLRLTIENNRVQRLADGAGNKIPVARLEPVQIGSIHPGHQEDRVLVRSDAIPPLLEQMLLAVEDRSFYEHAGISLRGLARAMLANVRAGEVQQGGSTLTQQLVKNFWLTRERSLMRKLVEIPMALLLELHYSKAQILEAYVNEVYLGQDGARAIHGMGLGAQYYFGRPLDELAPHQFAMLVGLLKGPSYYDPRRHPERAKQRRDTVLLAAFDQKLIDEAQLRRYQQQPLDVVPQGSAALYAFPAFIDLVRRQLSRDYSADVLASEGLQIHSTLDVPTQLASESALALFLKKREEVNGAVVVTAPNQGDVLAIVGDKTARSAGFNRALDAVRPIGSLAKPAVVLAALQQASRYTLATRVEDGPVEVIMEDGQQWVPQNYDGESLGAMPVLDALSASRNQAIARLGLDVGLGPVLKTFHALGVQREIPPYPSIFLGSLNLSPFEVAVMYQTIATGGYRTPLRAITDVLDKDGEPLARYPVSPQAVIDEDLVYLLQWALRQVVVEGTGKYAYNRLPRELVVAGKTGTSDGYRDAWFAGFSGSHLAVVWMGRDDNGVTGLSGSSGPLPVWTEIMAAIPQRPLNLAPPASVKMVWMDEAGVLASARGCPGAREYPLLDVSLPTEASACGKVQGAPKGMMKWLKGLFD